MSTSAGKSGNSAHRRTIPSFSVEHFDWQTFDPAMLSGGMDSPFAAELVAYRDHLGEMLLEHRGEYVVIKENQIISFHRTRSAAVRAVKSAYGRQPVLVKQVAESESIRRVSGAEG